MKESFFAEKSSLLIGPTFWFDVALTCVLQLAIVDQSFADAFRQASELVPILLPVTSQSYSY